MNSLVKRIVTLAVTQLILFGAGIQCRSPMSCDQLFDKRLQMAPIATASGKDFAQWVRDNFPRDDLYGVKGGPNFNWKVDGRQYMAFLSSDVGPYIIADISPEPSVKEVLSCLGKPEFYDARSLIEADGRGVSFGIGYPSKGVVFSYIKYGLLLPNSFDENSTFNRLAVYPHMSEEEYIDRVIGSEQLANPVHAWPEPFTRITISP